MQPYDDNYIYICTILFTTCINLIRAYADLFEAYALLNKSLCSNYLKPMLHLIRTYAQAVSCWKPMHSRVAFIKSLRGLCSHWWPMLASIVIIIILESLVYPSVLSVY
jgi:hypothetical protein